MTDSVRARLRAELDAGGYVAGSAQAEWEQEVEEAVDPLVEALKRGVAESPFNSDRKAKP